ncbi:MAG: biopolymer transporter ExbD [Myxococcota bacterium]
MYDATRKRRRNGRRKRDHAETITHLNITPMLDMMTIILIFLIKSYSTSTSNVNVANLTIPHSTTKLDIQDSLQLIVTTKEVIVDDQTVIQLDGKGNLLPEDLGAEGSYLVERLYNALDEKSRDFKEVEEFGGLQFNGRIAIIADRAISYQTLFKILYTAGRAEFGSFKLFVQKPDA